MADSPDPTRRLRPLLEARSSRMPVLTDPARSADEDGDRDPVPDGPGWGGSVSWGREAGRPGGATAGWTPVWPTAATDHGVRGSAAGGRHRPVGSDAGGPDRYPDTEADELLDEVPDGDDPEARDARGVRRPGLLGGRRPWDRWRERWVPDGPGVRIDPGRRGSAVLSVIAIGAVVAAALGLFGSGGTAVAPSTVAVVDGRIDAALSSTESPSQQVSSPSPGAAEVPPSAPPTALVVAVTGAVLRPGIVTLPPGARVADAIAAAGGVLDGTDYTGLNLAARVADGDSVVVGGTGQGLRSSGAGGAATGPTAGDKADGLVDLNDADAAELETLPGVGPVMAGNIVAWREANGGFTAVDQLQEITGIGPARFATLAPLVRVG